MQSIPKQSSLLPPGAALLRASSAEMRVAMRRFVTGVTVVTTFDESQTLVGMTASSFTSVSLEPPLVLVCLGEQSRTFRHCARRGRYTINLLSDTQGDTATKFAVRGGARDDACPWRMSDRGLPLLADSLAGFECRLVNSVMAGDHAILIGEVEAITTCEDSGPLVYHDGRLFGLDAGIPAPS
jgi:flavin reductase (DIM6/NTAB) family NADH-FMN oxidoreductase RutF